MQELFWSMTLMFAGRAHSGINETIIWTSVGMGITITLLITIALCYIAREKCKKRHEPSRWRMYPPRSWTLKYNPPTGIVVSPTLSASGRPRAYYLTIWNCLFFCFGSLAFDFRWQRKSSKLLKNEYLCIYMYIILQSVFFVISIRIFCD